ncbi:hypothetical protein QTP86_023115, partial [Hemibagrus guttatus]
TMASARISACLVDISSWMTAHQLKLNPSKTELLIILGDPSPAQDLAISLNNSMIPLQPLLATLGRIRPFLSTQATQALVQSLVISRLDYCSSLLAGLPLNAIRPLQMIQNAAAPLVFNLPKFSHITPLLRSLHWLPVAARIRFKTLMLAYKAKNGPAPSYLKALVTPRTAPRSLRSTSTARLVPPSLREKVASVVILLFIVLRASGHEKDPIVECLKDNDYDELLKIINEGLPPTETPHSVAIIGGGIAGLTAAKYLQDAGHKITIIEASDGIGGRIKTYRNKPEDWYAEFGAMRIPSFHWILRNLTAKLGLKLNKFIEEDINTYYYINGLLHKTYKVKENPDVLNYSLSDQEKGKSADELFSQSLWKIREYLKSHDCEAMLKHYDAYSLKEYLVNEVNISKGALCMIGDILNENSFYYISLLESLYLQADINDETTYLEISGGFDRLPLKFFDILNSTILLNSKVRGISYTDNNVTVFYNEKHSSMLTQKTFDYILVTATAKATLFISFQPPLPHWKSEALRSVHYASSTKVVLSFSRRFWEDESIFGGRSITDLPSRFIYYPSHSFKGKGGALLASYTISDEAALFHGMSDDDLKLVVLNDLMKIHGEYIQDLYTGGIVKKWGLDPYSLGAFAIFTPYQKTYYAENLARNVSRIYFAGEHVDMPHGWIETAMKTALRAAKTINSAK